MKRLSFELRFRELAFNRFHYIAISIDLHLSLERILKINLKGLLLTKSTLFWCITDFYYFFNYLSVTFFHVFPRVRS